MHNVIKKITAISLCVVLVFASFGSLSIYAKSPKTSEGTFTCDWFNESIVYPFTYSDEYFNGSSYEYNHEFATFALGLSMASFESFDTEHPDENIRHMLTQCGYEVKSYGYDTEGYDTVGVAFGRKDININNKAYTVIVAPIRSGNYGMEWGGNMRIGTGVNHKGFDLAKELVFQYLNEYLKTISINNEVKILFPGYSRGASISNLVAAELDDGSYITSLSGVEDNIAKLNLKMENIYAYTFEAPQCTRNTDASNPLYANIFNIINPNDYVPKFVMNEWGFTHFGTVYYLPSYENCDNYSQYYDKVCTEFDTMMADTGKKSGSYFYDDNSVKSSDATLDFIFNTMADKIFISQDKYAEEYEDAVVFIAGQYLGQKMGTPDAAKTFGVSAASVLMGLLPTNIKLIKNDGYRSYLAKQIADSKAGAGMSRKEVESLLNLLNSIIELVDNNTYNVFSLLSQLKTMIYVHQPYIALSWMRILTSDDIEYINSPKERLSVNYLALNLKYNTNAMLKVDYDKTAGHIEWKSDNPKIASVNEKGIVRAGMKGKTNITAELIDDSGKVIAITSTKVSVQMNLIQMIFVSLQSISM